LQGAVIGLFRANPIIVSIASLSLIHGIAQRITGGHSIYAAADTLTVFKGKIFGVPAALGVFLLAVLAGELLLRKTRFGLNVYFVGSNLRAATVAGVNTWRTVLEAYGFAGLFAGCSGL